MNTRKPYEKIKINASIIKSYDDVKKMTHKDLLNRAINFEENSGLANSWIQNEILHRMSFYVEERCRQNV